MPEDSRENEEFRRELTRLVGSVCWGMIAGHPTGSVVSLDFGSRVRRAHAIPNPHLSVEQQEYEGEFSLFVECAWRIDSKTQVVGGWTEPNGPGGPIVTALQSLVGAVVETVDASPPAWDLTIHLSNGLSLRLFCDQTNPEDSAGNYVYFVPDKAYAVGLRSDLRISSLTV